MAGERSLGFGSAGAPLPWSGGDAMPERTATVRYRIGESVHALHVREPARTVSGRGLQATWRWQPDGEGYRLWLRLANRGKSAVHLLTVDVLTAPMPDLGTPPAGWSVYQSGWSSCTPALARHLDDGLYADPATRAYRDRHEPHREPQDDGAISSEWVTVVAGRRGFSAAGRAVLLGFVTLGDQLAELRVHAGGRSVTARCHFDGAVLHRGGSVRSEVLLLKAGPDPLALLEEWAAAAGQEMGARLPAFVPSGWCSRHCPGGGSTAAEVLENVAAIARQDLGLGVVLVDDGYQAAVGDWLSPAPERFPAGMTPVSQAVRLAGQRMGIWTAPFGAAADSRLFAEHPEWVLRDDAGEPVVGWNHRDVDCYALDGTHPEVLAWLRETFGRMRREWDVDFFKIDFLFAAALPGRRHDATATRAQALRRGVDAIREAVGDDAFLLGSCAPLGPCAGLVDGMRVGPDVDPNWLPIWKHDLSMPSTENALRNAVTRAFLHGRLWANDPGCLLVRQRGAELDLVLNEMRTLVALTALLGGVTMDSDPLPQVRPGRLKYLRQALPPTGVAARPLDLFEREMPRLLVLPVEREWGRWWVAGLVNWGDRTTETTIGLAELGLPAGRYHVYHYWRRRYLGVTGDAVTIRRHQPHETAVLLFRPVSEEPDLLTTTFHVCQGAVEVADCRSEAVGLGWRITVVLHKEGRQFGQVLFTVPAGWRAVEALVDGARRPAVQVAPGVVGLGLTLEDSAQVEVRFANV